jgi:hypothetical protein
MDEETKLLRNCVVCKHEDVEQVELDFLGENINGEEAAAKLDCTLSQFKRHIDMHLKKDIALHLSSNAPALAKMIFNKTNQLIESCDRQLKLISEVNKEWKDKKKPEWITAIVKLETVLSSNIEKLSKINGELKESSSMKVEQMNIQVNNMTQEIIEGMCPQCKVKLAPVILKSVGLENVKSEVVD